VLGHVASDQAFTVDADIVRDWTKNFGSLGTGGSAANSMSGIASNIGSYSFTLNVNGTLYAIIALPNWTRVLSSNGFSVPVNYIRPGEFVQVDVWNANGLIVTASLIRDMTR